MTIRKYFTHPSITGTLYGILGGIALILSTRLTTNGPLQVSPYPPLLIGAILTVAIANKSEITLNSLFITGLLTFGIMTIFLYFYLVTFVNPNSGMPFQEHLWRLGLMALIGIISSLFISFIVIWFAKYIA